MKNKILSLTSIATLAVVFGMISWGSAFAQSTPSDQTTPQTQPAPTPDTPPSQQTPQSQPTPTPDTPPATQQPPSSSTQTPDQTQPSNPPDSSAPSAAAPSAGASAGAASDTQSFSGTVVKSGDKYMLKDDSGKMYDIDHQTDVAKFDGKRVRVQGKLDDSGTKIMVK